ncbi:MAG: phosphoglycerate dehydrogenase [Acidimicrobiales bacterium]
MARVLVTEELAERGLAGLAEAGHEVDVRLGLSPAELLTALPGAAALIVRSATKVTAEALAAGADLVVVGRAGIGVDNVDVAEATRRGVMVVNAPQSISLSTAEHTMALLLAQARNVSQAHAALRAGRWEKSKWQGVELHGKTLGLLGLGRIGSLVAQRASAFGMRLTAWDPWSSVDRARRMGVELAELDDVVAQADFLSLHLLLTAESRGLVDADLLAKAKPGLRIINTSRGAIIDEAALAEAIVSGHIGGAALDVFVEEPTTSSPLFGLDQVVVTPHLGASTGEAQDKAGITIAEQVVLALAGEFIASAVNVNAGEASEAVRPFVPLAECLGRVFAALAQGLPPVLEVEYQGTVADEEVAILTLSALKGLMSAGSDEPVSYVNAPQLVEERGCEVRETRTTTAHDYVSLVTLRGGGHAVAGTLSGMRGDPRIVMIDDHRVEVPPAAHMLVVRNDDRVGMAHLVTGAVADAGVNLADMALGRSPSGGTALMVLATGGPLPADALAALAAAPGILDVHQVALPPTA